MVRVRVQGLGGGLGLILGLVLGLFIFLFMSVNIPESQP